MGTTLAAPIIPLWFSLRRAVNRPGAWTRPSKGREEERKRESERKERAKMGTDGFLASVPDFRSSAARDLALTNDFRTVALYHSLLTTHHSQPLLSSHYGSRSEKPSTVPEHGPVLRKGEKRRERERVREKRERKWGLTGSWRLYPIFAVALLGISLLPTIFALLLFTTHYSPHTTHNRSCHPTMVLAQR